MHKAEKRIPSIILIPPTVSPTASRSDPNFGSISRFTHTHSQLQVTGRYPPATKTTDADGNTDRDTGAAACRIGDRTTCATATGDDEGVGCV